MVGVVATGTGQRRVQVVVGLLVVRRLAVTERRLSGVDGARSGRRALVVMVVAAQERLER